jgi:hypothetical protein
MCTRRVLAVSLLLLIVGFAAAPSMQQVIQPAPIPHDNGQGVTPSFEGWYRNPDGTFTLSFGYFNRNYREALDIPVGPNNRFDPAPVDQGQPTHFLPRRQTGVFTVVVPKEFGAQQKITWTIVANGQTNSIPGHLRPEWEIDALKEVTSGNTPPTIKFDANGKPGQGPSGTTLTTKATQGQPVTLTVWATDDNVRKRENEGRAGPGLGIVWSKFRGPGAVTFSPAQSTVQDGKATTAATFAAPGEYVLRVLAWDASGAQAAVMAGGFQCCWTNGYVRVNVAGGRGSQP